MHGLCVRTARFGNRLRWTTDTNFFHRVVGFGPVVEFFVQAPVVALATGGPIMRRMGTCYELPWVVHAHARANSTRSQTPSLFCWQACETNETGMKPE